MGIFSQIRADRQAQKERQSKIDFQNRVGFGRNIAFKNAVMQTAFISMNEMDKSAQEFVAGIVESGLIPISEILISLETMPDDKGQGPVQVLFIIQVLENDGYDFLTNDYVFNSYFYIDDLVTKRVYVTGSEADIEAIGQNVSTIVVNRVANAKNEAYTGLITTTYPKENGLGSGYIEVSLGVLPEL